MAYKPTGKPVGRPKTKEYQTISLKIPQTLFDLVKRYASQHRQTVSELIREGLEYRIGEGDPLAQRYGSVDSAEQKHLGNTEIPSWTDRESESVGVLEEIRTALAQQATQLQELKQAFEQRPVVSTPSVSSGQATKALTGRQGTSEPVREGSGGHTPQEVHVGSSNTVLQEDGTIAASDTSAQQPGILDKAALVARLHQMRASGLSLSQIARRLQAEGLPTLSGKGKWQKGTVDKLLRSQPKRQAAPA
jgi:Recombinase